MTNVNNAIFTLRTLKPKEKFVYYCGHLARNRDTVIDGVPLISADELFVADEAMRLSENGKVHLVQQKNGKLYDYIAIGR